MAAGPVLRDSARTDPGDLARGARQRDPLGRQHRHRRHADGGRLADQPMDSTALSTGSPGHFAQQRLGRPGCHLSRLWPGRKRAGFRRWRWLLRAGSDRAQDAAGRDGAPPDDEHPVTQQWHGLRHRDRPGSPTHRRRDRQWRLVVGTVGDHQQCRAIRLEDGPGAPRWHLQRPRRRPERERRGVGLGQSRHSRLLRSLPWHLGTGSAELRSRHHQWQRRDDLAPDLDRLLCRSTDPDVRRGGAGRGGGRRHPGGGRLG